jgi:acetate---CoA ligase (ADP-forming)
LRKPIILLHPGKSARARSSASTHTGALAGDYAVMSALLRHEAVVLVDTIDELIDAAELLARTEPPTGGAGIITNSGAIKGFALDFAETIGLDIPPPSPATRAALQAALPAFAAPDNPVDVTAQVIKDIGIWTRATNALAADPAIGSLAMLAVPGAPKQAIEKGQSVLSAIVASGKPAVVAALGDESPIPAEFYSMFRERGVPVFRSPERAMQALAHATRYGRALATANATAPSINAPPLPHEGTLPEHVGKAYLAALGISIPKGKLARDLATAKAIAAEIGYPLALKAQASTLSHKSDSGGVILGIENVETLASAWDAMQAAMASIALDGILTEQMITGGLEMIVGARRDPSWGPVVMVGLGGIFVEALKDVRLMPASLPKERIISECYQLNGSAMLRGVRGRPAVDVEALADIVLRVAAAMVARPEITEIDINPLSVLPAGQGAIALDALIVTQRES